MCKGTKKCSLPKREQSSDHLYQYHSSLPVTFLSCWTGQKVEIGRSKDGNFHCVHPSCTKYTPIRRNCPSHHIRCKQFSKSGIKIETAVSSASSSINHRASSTLSQRITVKEGSSAPTFVQPNHEAGEKLTMKFNSFSN
jgi:hypothetical protein